MPDWKQSFSWKKEFFFFIFGHSSYVTALGVRKLWQIFPIKQKFHAIAAFLDIPNFWIWSSLDVFTIHCATILVWAQWAIKKILVFNTIHIMKQAAVIINFCRLEIFVSFLVPRIIESAPKTFMPIQIPELHSVYNVHILDLTRASQLALLWMYAKLFLSYKY